MRLRGGREPMSRIAADARGSAVRHGQTVLIVAALLALGAAGAAALLSASADRPVLVAAALEPVPEGPVFRLSRGDPQWDELSLPARRPTPLLQACKTGGNVVLILSDETRVAYGPCRRPPAIELLRSDLLGVARGRDLRASVAPGCARRVLSDWFDNGSVDGLYRRVCYEGALDLLPEGFEDVGQAEAAIRRALCAWAACDKLAVAEATQGRKRVATSGYTHGPQASLALPCDPDAEEPPCGAGADVGAKFEHVLYTHCGIAWTIFDGRLWLAEPPLLDEGVRGAPPGWGDPTQAGVMRLLEEARAEFRAGSLVATFVPAPPDYEREACD